MKWRHIAALFPMQLVWVGEALTAQPECSMASRSWTSSWEFDARAFGNYIVSNNNWGGTPGQRTWAKDGSCWGATTTATKEQGNVQSYPSVTRGWTQHEGMLKELSSSGTSDWTAKSGLGVRVDALEQARIRWTFSAPTSRGSRWLGLLDVYFHKTAAPGAGEFPPQVDLMINQALMDLPLPGLTNPSETYYSIVARRSRATTVTLGGNAYLVYVDAPGESAYHQPGGHTIHLFLLPTALTGRTGVQWGSHDALHDLKAIIDFLRSRNPRDDAGNALRFANGEEVKEPLVPDSLYLTAINAGWEIDVGTEFTTKDFCVSLQKENRCR